MFDILNSLMFAERMLKFGIVKPGNRTHFIVIDPLLYITICYCEYQQFSGDDTVNGRLFSIFFNRASLFFCGSTRK